jgi:hypothetical protein
VPWAAFTPPQRQWHPLLPPLSALFPSPHKKNRIIHKNTAAAKTHEIHEKYDISCRA